MKISLIIIFTFSLNLVFCQNCLILKGKNTKLEFNFDQAAAFLCDSVSNSNINMKFTLGLMKSKCEIDLNNQMFYVEKISKDLIPLLINLFEDFERDFMANALLYQIADCPAGNLYKYKNRSRLFYWKDFEKSQDKTKWLTWEWK